MKNKLMILCALFVFGCSDVSSIKYENDAGGCTYTEEYRPRKVFPFDWFGARDNDVRIHYSGTKCETMINKDIKSGLRKKQESESSENNKKQDNVNK
ncbi:MAG: hypothetical protein JW974_01130 [Alphaproteobacteria bacterium]|nr:hypothetical protein [Alphaproteobacteria bacterium]MBN2675390.1 hypothetical protein [Alphaproteobacteria bacterium]